MERQLIHRAVVHWQATQYSVHNWMRFICDIEGDIAKLVRELRLCVLTAAQFENFECKLNEPMHIGMRLLHPAASDHSVSISRQQVQRIFSFSLRSRAVTSFCSWLLLNEWIQWVEHALRKTLVLVVRHYSGGGSSHVKWTAHIRLHYPLFVLQMTISPVRFSTLK